MKYKLNKLENTHYTEVVFNSGNRNKVKIITELFENGFINILIGTASLLGEGWDSPCINNLILASGISSFMLSNQMRGRAIRFDKNNPQKTANIWHLASVDPPPVIEAVKKILSLSEAEETTGSLDYLMLEKRFDCFLGPSYFNGAIESGIERTNIVKPPFTEQKVNEINNQMLALSLDREGMRQKWELQLVDTNIEVFEEEMIPKSVHSRPFVFYNGFAALLLTIFFSVIIYFLSSYLNGLAELSEINLLMVAAYLIAMLFILFLLWKCLNMVIKFISPKKMISNIANAILRTLIHTGQIKSLKSEAITEERNKSQVIICYLKNATTYEKNIFNNAVKELLSPIQNPRYIIIKTIFKAPYYRQSYACPSILGANQRTVNIFEDYLKHAMGSISVLYTRDEKGRQLILKCHRNSFISANEKLIKRKTRFSKWN